MPCDCIRGVQVEVSGCWAIWSTAERDGYDPMWALSSLGSKASIRNGTAAPNSPSLNRVLSFCLSKSWCEIIHSGSGSESTSQRVVQSLHLLNPTLRRRMPVRVRDYWMAWIIAEEIEGIGPENTIEGGQKSGSGEGKTNRNIAMTRWCGRRLVYSATGVGGRESENGGC